MPRDFRTSLGNGPESAIAGLALAIVVLLSSSAVALTGAAVLSTTDSMSSAQDQLWAACRSLGTEPGGAEASPACPSSTTGSAQSVGSPQASPSSATPPARTLASMAYDPRLKAVVLFGGLGASGPLGDTWTYSNGVWTELDRVSPPSPRYAAAVAYDDLAGDNYLVLFGGHGATGYLNDSWTLAGTTWSRLAASNASLVARDNASMAFVSVSSTVGAVFLFGGENKNGVLDDTWRFVDGTWSYVHAPIRPSARASAGLTYDASPTARYLVLFGGVNGSKILDDTWEFQNMTQWVNVTAGSAPAQLTPRYSAGLAYDNANGYVLLFGGLGPSGPLNDTWWFSGARWHLLLSPTLPSARSGTAMTYDTATSSVLLFGGNSGNVSDPVPLGDTWTFVGNSWVAAGSNLAPVSSSADPGFAFAVLVGGVLVALLSAGIARASVRRSRARFGSAPPPTNPPSHPSATSPSSSSFQPEGAPRSEPETAPESR